MLKIQKDSNEEGINWNDFWVNLPQDPLEHLNAPRTWGDVSWRISLQEWLHLFKQLAPGNKLLECGCGTATLSRYMAKHGYDCTMLDNSEEAINLAKYGFSKMLLKGDFHVGDINHLNFDDNSFDIVYSGGVLDFFENIEKPISEMARVIKPGGIFSATIFSKTTNVQTLGNLQITIAHAIRSIFKGRWHEIFRYHRLIPKNYHVNTKSLAAYVKACHDAGLIDIKVLYTAPFPDLSLPKALSNSYVRFLLRNENLWRKFNLTNHFWHRWIGITIMLYATKE
jgi:ubiquinone/menaquinone biosynthesis C-methylase UbiE